MSAQFNKKRHADNNFQEQSSHKRPKKSNHVSYAPGLHPVDQKAGCVQQISQYHKKKAFRRPRSRMFRTKTITLQTLANPPLAPNFLRPHPQPTAAAKATQLESPHCRPSSTLLSEMRLSHIKRSPVPQTPRAMNASNSLAMPTSSSSPPASFTLISPR